MIIRELRILPALCAVALAGCGLPGAPLPPSLELPKPVTDLRAERQGSKVTLVWTPPRETTDRTAIRGIGATRICRAIVAINATGSAPKGCETFVAAVNVAPASRAEAHPPTTSFTDKLPEDMQSQHRLETAVYTVEVLNDHGRTAGESNPASVALAPTLPPPVDLRAELTRDYIVLTWTAAPVTTEPAASGLSYGYRVSRQLIGGKAGSTTEDLWRTVGVRYFDRNFEWDQRYTYRVAAITSVPSDGAAVVAQGEWSAPVEIATKDVFPPVVPTGLQAVYTEAGPDRFIDLTWLPSSSADVAGYNIYRWEAGAQPVKVNGELLKTPTWRDAGVAAGHRYYYAVTAVDTRGNESARSEPANELVPK